MNPYQPVKDFEGELCKYTGAPYAVAVNSCSAALLLSLQWSKPIWWDLEHIGLPNRTYVSVPCAVKLAGWEISWLGDIEWSGTYQLRPTNVWDSARRFTSGMYLAGQFQCVSFATSKILGDEQGGAILHDNAEADSWFRRMRFDGRTEGVDPLDETFDLVGHHCMMTPSVAARLLLKLYHLPKHNADLGHYEYPNLSEHPAFK